MLLCAAHRLQPAALLQPAAYWYTDVARGSVAAAQHGAIAGMQHAFQCLQATLVELQGPWHALQGHTHL